MIRGIQSLPSSSDIGGSETSRTNEGRGKGWNMTLGNGDPNFSTDVPSELGK